MVGEHPTQHKKIKKLLDRKKHTLLDQLQGNVSSLSAVTHNKKTKKHQHKTNKHQNYHFGPIMLFLLHTKTYLSKHPIGDVDFVLQLTRHVIFE